MVNEFKSRSAQFYFKNAKHKRNHYRRWRIDDIELVMETSPGNLKNVAEAIGRTLKAVHVIRNRMKGIIKCQR